MDNINWPFLNWLYKAHHIIEAYFQRAYERLDMRRYSQEPAYVSALFARLDGVVYDGPEGRIEIQSTIINDRGPNSAESQWGADFAITAKISYASCKTMEKAVLGQAKRGYIFELPIRERKKLVGQCKKMSSVTDHYVVLEIPKSMHYKPTILQSVGVDIEYDENLNSFLPTRFELTSYLFYYLIACLHGDKRKEFVNAVAESSLSSLHIIVERSNDHNI